MTFPVTQYNQVTPLRFHQPKNFFRYRTGFHDPIIDFQGLGRGYLNFGFTAKVLDGLPDYERFAAFPDEDFPRILGMFLLKLLINIVADERNVDIDMARWIKEVIFLLTRAVKSHEVQS